MYSAGGHAQMQAISYDPTPPRPLGVSLFSELTLVTRPRVLNQPPAYPVSPLLSPH